MKQFFIDNYNFIKFEFVVFVAALIAPTAQMLILIGILIVADTISGVFTAIKKSGLDGFKSRVLSNGLLPKLILYPLAIIVAQAMESQFPFAPIMKTTGFMIMSIEVKSISEHYKAMFGVTLFDSVKSVLKRESENKSK